MFFLIVLLTIMATATIADHDHHQDFDLTYETNYNHFHDQASTLPSDEYNCHDSGHQLLKYDDHHLSPVADHHYEQHHSPVVPVPAVKTFPVPVVKHYPVYIPKPYPVPVDRPVPVKVPVYRKIKVPVPRPIPIIIPKPVPIFIPRPIFLRERNWSKGYGNFGKWNTQLHQELH